jgi:predicted  nucleic acid-binding Zn ribbon protein
MASQTSAVLDMIDAMTASNILSTIAAHKSYWWAHAFEWTYMNKVRLHSKTANYTHETDGESHAIRVKRPCPSALWLFKNSWTTPLVLEEILLLGHLVGSCHKSRMEEYGGE